MSRTKRWPADTPWNYQWPCTDGRRTHSGSEAGRLPNAEHGVLRGLGAERAAIRTLIGMTLGNPLGAIGEGLLGRARPNLADIWNRV